MSETLDVARLDNIVVITMDDGKANALSKDLIADLSAEISAAEADPAAGAVVIAGREGRFSGGFDLAVMMSGDPGAVVDLVSDGGTLVHQLFSCSIPVVAACTGHALAAGALILLGCDVRIGAMGPYKIGLNEVAIGMVLPEWAGTIARARLAPTHFQRSVLNARVTDAAGAVAAGFLDHAIELHEVVERALEEAEVLGALDRTAYGESVNRYRRDVADTMAAQIAADRTSVA